MELNKIYNEDCIDTMARMPDNFIDLVVTSPPYFLKKEYEKNISYDQYCNMMNSVFNKLSLKIKPGGYCVFNFGDYFNSGNRFYNSDVPGCFPASINFYKWGVDDSNFDLQSTRIWRKQFAKMGIPFVCNNHPRNIFDYEHIWTFRKKNGKKEEFVNNRKLSQRGVIGENWTSKAYINKHCAAFPVDLPIWAINVYSSNENDIIYDPFMGSGTTAIAATLLNRNYIGSEINEEYCEIAINRIKEHTNQLKLII